MTRVARLGPPEQETEPVVISAPFLSHPGHLLPARLVSAQLKGWRVVALPALVPADKAW